MAVNELDRDFLRLLHTCDQIDNVIAGIKGREMDEVDRKQQVGNMVMLLETEMLDSKYTDAGKDVTPISDAIAAGRTYWKS